MKNTEILSFALFPNLSIPYFPNPQTHYILHKYMIYLFDLIYDKFIYFSNWVLKGQGGDNKLFLYVPSYKTSYLELQALEDYDIQTLWLPCLLRCGDADPHVVSQQPQEFHQHFLAYSQELVVGANLVLEQGSTQNTSKVLKFLTLKETLAFDRSVRINEMIYPWQILCHIKSSLELIHINS